MLNPDSSVQSINPSSVCPAVLYLLHPDLHPRPRPRPHLFIFILIVIFPACRSCDLVPSVYCFIRLFLSWTLYKAVARLALTITN
jgi:hypothetical protein